MFRPPVTETPLVSMKRRRTRRRHTTPERRPLMARYGKTAARKVKNALHERKHGTLKSGSGRMVRSRKQAIAIGLSEARRAGGKVPRKGSGR
jgi:hypothetical protein